MGAYHARKLRPKGHCKPRSDSWPRRHSQAFAPDVPEETTADRWFLFPVCTTPHTGFLLGRPQQRPCRCAREKQTREKPSKKGGARAHTQTGRQTHPKQQRGQPQTLRPAGTRRPRLGQRKVWSPHVSPVSSASLLAVGIHAEVLMPRVDDHRVQPRCQYFSYKDHPRD